MTFHRAKSIERLYEDVRDYDLVLVPDAPLASAINRRLDRPHFGTFATTPRRVAAGRREQAEDRVAFLDVIEETDHDWKATAYAIGNVLQCWEHQGRIDAVLEYDAYADPTTRDVVEILSQRHTTSKQLTEYTVPADESVAVVGLDQFTQLERRILPQSYDTYDIFTEEGFDYPQFHIFESSTAIVDSLLETITADNAENVAIVLDSASRYSSLVESALEAAEIPFYGGPGFIDDPDHRAVLQLLRTAFRGSDTTVADLKPILPRLGIDVPRDHDEKRLHVVDLPALEWIETLYESIHEHTFEEVLTRYEGQSGRSLETFREELDRIGLANARITQSRVDDLAFYFETYDVPVDRENEGVIMADAKSSGYVDRPAVFYLGLDDGWTDSAPQRPWVETDTQFERYIARFQLLLQSGDEQYYLVQDTAGGQPVTPCLYLNEILDEDFERFSDLPSTAYSRIVDGGGDGFAREPLDVEPEAVDTISQSSLNAYVNSPRDYFFGQLVDGPDKDYFTEGNLLHDFAEFSVNHPDLVDADLLEEVAEVILEEVRPFYPDTDRSLRRRKYRIGLETIVEFLETEVPSDGDFLTPASGFGTNFFAEYFDVDIDAPHTERWFENPDLGLKGKIDLVHSPNHLVDFKSSAKKRATQIVKRSAIDPPADTQNFQAILYLTHYRTVRPDEPLEFTFFYFLQTLDDVIAGDADLDDALTTVSYHPEPFDEYVSSRDAFETLLDGYNDCQATFEDLGFPAYRDIMTQLSFPEATDKDALRKSEFASSFERKVVTATSDDVNAEKGCDQAIRALNGVRRQAFFREDLDAFEAFVQERLEELNRYRAGEARFPIEGLAGEPNYRRVDHRDLLLEGGTDE